MNAVLPYEVVARCLLQKAAGRFLKNPAVLGAPLSLAASPPPDRSLIPLFRPAHGVQPGSLTATVISKDNLDKVRHYNLRLPLVNSKPIVVDPRFAELTRKYAGQARFDTTNREVSGWTAGLPFQGVTQNDPNAGDKLLWNARPSWYLKIRLAGKRWILAMAHGKKHTWDKSNKGTPEEFPSQDLRQAQYWNPVNVWEPREVYVIEAEAPPEHVYGKKVLYMDTDLNANMIWQSEVYDRKGEFWKHGFFSSDDALGKLFGVKYRHPSSHNFFDFKAMHGTVAYIHDWVLDSGLKAKDVSIEQLEAGAK